MDNTNRSERTNTLTRIIAFTLAVVLAASFLLPLTTQQAFAEPTSAEVQAEADEASARLAAAEAEMMQIGVDYQVALSAHEAALIAMAEAQARIDAAQVIISETQQLLGNRAKQMYRQGPLSFINVLFGASSFEAFTTSWDLLNMINQENADLIQANKDARLEAQHAHEEYSLQEQAAADYVAEMEALMARAQKKVAEQEAEYAALSAEAAALVEKEQAARIAEQVKENPEDYGTPIDIPAGGYGSVVGAAQAGIGTPYVSGGTGNGGFDCSGFTQWCYLNGLGINIGRDTYSQFANASATFSYSAGGAQPGDVLWWPASTGYTHVAIYVGGGQYIHAPVPGQSVCYSSWLIDQTIVLRF